MNRPLRTATLSVLLLAAASSCECGAPPPLPGEIAGDGFGGVLAVNATTVKLTTQKRLDRTSVTTAAFAIHDYTSLPFGSIAISAVDVATDTEALLTTAALRGGVVYTLVVDGLKDETGRTLAGTLNFQIGGASTAGDPTSVSIVLDPVATARQWEGELTALATVAVDGTFSDELVAYPIVDDGTTMGAVLQVRVDPSRTTDPADDPDPAADRRAYGVLIVDAEGRLVSGLTPFAVPTATIDPVLVHIAPPPEVPIDAPTLPPPPVDDSPGDDVKVVRLVVDDTAGRELVSPGARCSFEGDGDFDATFPQTVILEPMDDPAGWWEATVLIHVDPDRTIDGTSADTFPYICHLVEQDVPYEGLAVNMIAPDEDPQTVEISLGKAEWTPVTFRVDVSGAYLTPDGAQKGVFPNEAVFVTGEWLNAVDALGNGCGDGFRGGENLCLKMRPLAGHAGVWTRTLWLPPGRPYGWKVVRCDAEAGCGPLNTLVTSSGRAFATVMKNLASDNIDAFADPDTALIDPVHPEATVAGSQTLDYSSADVYVGDNGGSEPDPAGTPDGQRMFKQEVPDLAVVVQGAPIVTRIIHVGTWRDVNLPLTVAEILATSATVDLGAADYDDGFIGRFPPSRGDP